MAYEIKKVDSLPKGERPETGPMQFGDDWPGVFIRGDNAFAYALVLTSILEGKEDLITQSLIKDLRNLLRSSNLKHRQKN